MVAFSYRVERITVMIVLYLVLVWFFVILGLSLLGMFVSNRSSPPLALGLAAVGPVALYALGYACFPALRRFIRSTDRWSITVLHTWRVIGVVFLILASRSLLPALFALPAGLGDLFIGITAPFVAFLWASGTRWGASLLVCWTVLGMLDLVAAVGLGVLSSVSSAGLLAGSITTAVMSTFPLSQIPTFLVPLSFILHLIGLSQLRQHKEERA